MMVWINNFNLKKTKKFRKIIFLSFFMASSILFVAAGCENKMAKTANKINDLEKNWDQKVNLGLGQSWFAVKSKDPDRVAKFLKNLKTEFNKLKNANSKTRNLPDVDFDFVGIEDSKTKISQLKSSNNSHTAIDFAISDAITTIEEDPEKELYNGLQTLTWAFKNSLDNPIFYKDGSKNDPLRKSAKQLDNLFNKIPYNEWSNKKNDPQKWDGIAYRFLYDETNPKRLISYYRGMIMIAGDENVRNEIKKAWDEKDWEKFRNFGIIHGKLTSAGKFKMQNFIIKKHFKNNLKARTINEDRKNHPDKYLQAEGSVIGQDPKYKIAFDDEASFAWTESTKDGKQYTLNKKDGKIEIFILTNPASYDIGSFRPGFNRIQANMISEAFVNLAKNGRDTYGQNVGYNGYRKINQTDPEFRRIYEKSK
ncbi:DNA repair protein [Mycoplasma flocculare]|uniref:High affinity transport system protein n=2 Tax=Mesomycoplasma flocculare TaxID=2128 RepID=A0AAW9XAK3_MESFC|nr:DNA repair protein [Mesomycoplasma flocculare]MXR39713.1 DNA repair protein [Mycoplasma sp. MF12]MXR12518.1 DNA repair protein [Mesomycoplasma flocculare]MXR13798.1 DNA repair protein [Mesomycoplasma flocculare]MXR22813.1 DNA repair protein [Mesomycoplasma flocculare]